MILKASQRGGAKQLALHLLRTDENEHVAVHEVRGFLTDDIVEALKETQALAKGTKCKQFLFSVSFNPPEIERVDIAAFEAAIAQVEERNRLTGQPRIVVFHEKEGRRHAHVVWSRIDTQTMTARNLPHFKLKLRDISRGLYMEHGWKMPRGLMNTQARDPRNFTLAEWQQSKRIGVSARDIKQMVQECWAVSDSRSAFAHALAERGFILARGDRRDFVLLSCEGEVLGLRSQTGKRAKELRAKIGDAQDLPCVDEARAQITYDMRQTFRSHMREAREHSSARQVRLETRRQAMTETHRQERDKLEAGLTLREAHEARARAARLRTGFAGIWQFMTGTRTRIVRQNEREALNAFRRDRMQWDALITEQLEERRALQQLIKAERRAHVRTILKLRSERERLNLFNERAKPIQEYAPEQKQRDLAESNKPKRQRRPRRTNRPPRGKRRGPRPEM